MKFYILTLTLLFTISCNNSPKGTETGQNVPIKKDTVAHVDADTVATIIPAPQEETPPIQLLKKHNLTDDDLYTDYDGGTQLADYFIIELIDKETFSKNKTLAVNMVSNDTTVVCIKNGTIKLPCKKGEIDFVNNPIEGDNYKEYTYIGQIPLLNAYLIRGVYWEDWNYFMVDGLAGKTVQTFINMPYISADGKYIVSLDFDTIEGVTFIELYEVTEDKSVEPLVGIYAKKWIPINTNTSVYWGNDNYLYVPVIHNSDYWAAEGNYEGIDQYIRLKPISS